VILSSGSGSGGRSVLLLVDISDVTEVDFDVLFDSSGMIKRDPRFC
jgi:hypothetical protein